MNKSFKLALIAGASLFVGGQAQALNSKDLGATLRLLVVLDSFKDSYQGARTDLAEFITSIKKAGAALAAIKDAITPSMTEVEKQRVLIAAQKAVITAFVAFAKFMNGNAKQIVVEPVKILGSFSPLENTPVGKFGQTMDTKLIEFEKLTGSFLKLTNLLEASIVKATPPAQAAVAAAAAATVTGAAAAAQPAQNEYDF